MTFRVFISYRRSDTQDAAGRLYDRLELIYSAERLFIDVDSIAKGEDFVVRMRDKVEQSDVVLALIGTSWLETRDPETAERRIDDPDDPVRIELQAALAHEKIIIPVLVGDAKMPRERQLPAPLRPLARRNAEKLVHESFGADVRRLSGEMERAVRVVHERHDAAMKAAEETRRREMEQLARDRAHEEARNAALSLEAEQRAQDRARREATLEPVSPPGDSNRPSQAAPQPFATPARHTELTPDHARKADAATQERTEPRTSWLAIAATTLATSVVWYDFFLYGLLAAHIGRAFFSEYPPETRNAFALGAFLAGALARPVGSLLFAHIADRLGRKRALVLAVMVMGGSTLAAGLLPGSTAWGIAAPVLLVILRVLQALAVGGAYPSSMLHIAESCGPSGRGLATSLIQASATLGLILALVVITVVQNLTDPAAFAAWGWRVPFLLSFILLLLGAWLGRRIEETAVFEQMKSRRASSTMPLLETFAVWKNAKTALVALVGLAAGQAVVWYTGQFYALFFLQNIAKVSAADANGLVATALLLTLPFFVLFGWLSDRFGRKPIIFAGLLLAILTYFPLFGVLNQAANPALAAAQSVRASVIVAPGDCSFQFNPIGTARFTTSCDIATGFLTRNAVPYAVAETASPGADAVVTIGSTSITSYDAMKAGTEVAAKGAAFNDAVFAALKEAGYPLVRSASAVYSMATDANGSSRLLTVSILVALGIIVAMVSAPMAAMLAEMFPAQIRASGISVPVQISHSWIASLVPSIAYAASVSTGNVSSGLWYPICVSAVTLVIFMLFVKETLGTDIQSRD